MRPPGPLRLRLRALGRAAERLAAEDPLRWPRRRRIPLAVAAAYTAIAIAVNDFTPFMVWDMFASARTEMTAIAFYASGQPADMLDYAAFFGPELPPYPERQRDFGVAGKNNYTVPELFSHIGRHHRGEAPAPGAVAAELVLQDVSAGEGGGLRVSRRRLWRGWALER